MGAFEKKKNVKYFVRFAKKVVDELGEDLSFIFTFNEPNVYTGMSYEAGIWPPNHKNPLLYYKVMRNLAAAHVETYIAIRSRHPDLAVGSAYHLTYMEGENFVGKISAWFASWAWNWYWLDRTKKAHDFIGINHYFTEKIRWFTKTHYAAKKNDYGWSMMPQNLGKVVSQALREGNIHYREWFG
jgi:beta-glucosidase